MDSPLEAQGLVTVASRHSVDETVVRIREILSARGIKLFALIDHSGEAEAVGLHMPSTRVMIFGNPKGGTPLMLASPGIAIDLPLKLLIAANAHDGSVTISYNSAEYLRDRHAVSEEHLSLLRGVAAIATQAGD